MKGTKKRWHATRFWLDLASVAPFWMRVLNVPELREKFYHVPVTLVVVFLLV